MIVLKATQRKIATKASWDFRFSLDGSTLILIKFILKQFFIQIIDNHTNKPWTDFGLTLKSYIVTVGDAVAIAGACTCGYHIEVLDSIALFLSVFLVIY